MTGVTKISFRPTAEISPPAGSAASSRNTAAERPSPIAGQRTPRTDLRAAAPAGRIKATSIPRPPRRRPSGSSGARADPSQRPSSGPLVHCKYTGGTQTCEDHACPRSPIAIIGKDFRNPCSFAAVAGGRLCFTSQRDRSAGGNGGWSQPAGEKTLSIEHP